MDIIRRIPVLVWFLIPTVLIVGVGVWFFSKGAAGNVDETKPLAVSKPVAGVAEFKIVGRNHVPVGTVVKTYNSNPPTSGPHWPSPAKNGIYDSQIPDEQLVHNLEHGYIWVSYRPSATESAGISDDDKKKLGAIVAGDNWKMIMTPRPQDDSKIILAAWGRLLKMNDLDIDKIKEFIKVYRNRGPENTPD